MCEKRKGRGMGVRAKRRREREDWKKERGDGKWVGDGEAYKIVYWMERWCIHEIAIWLTIEQGRNPFEVWRTMCGAGNVWECEESQECFDRLNLGELSIYSRLISMVQSCELHTISSTATDPSRSRVTSNESYTALLVFSIKAPFSLFSPPSAHNAKPNSTKHFTTPSSSHFSSPTHLHDNKDMPQLNITDAL